VSLTAATLYSPVEVRAADELRAVVELHLDVASVLSGCRKSRSGAAYVAIAINVYCKCIFQMFMLFQTYVASVFSGYYICCKCMFQMFHLFHMYVANVLSRCCICCNGYTHMLQAYVSTISHVASVCSECCSKCFMLPVFSLAGMGSERR
jgi:hypothetical protein